MDCLALVDADTIYFRAAYKQSKPAIIKAINDQMKKIEGSNFYTDMKVAVKGFGNFRKDIYPDYKSNRKRDEDLKPYLALGWEHMKEKWGAIEAHNMEADDLVCIWAHEARDMEMQYVICGIDKDLKQIPGNHYNYHKETWEFVDDDMANYNLMVQCLTGDSGDNIPGLRGIGPKKAEGILQGVPMDRRWNRVRAAWRKYPSNGGDCVLSRRLLEMIKTWDEFNDIQSQISGQTSERECNDGTEQNVPDSSVHSVSE